jgi:hypothetical protein
MPFTLPWLDNCCSPHLLLTLQLIWDKCSLDTGREDLHLPWTVLLEYQAKVIKMITAASPPHSPVEAFQKFPNCSLSAAVRGMVVWHLQVVSPPVFQYCTADINKTTTDPLKLLRSPAFYQHVINPPWLSHLKNFQNSPWNGFNHFFLRKKERNRYSCGWNHLGNAKQYMWLNFFFLSVR